MLRMMQVATTPEVDGLLENNAPVAIGVSGGKDSSAVTFATIEHLDAIGHGGPRVLIHSDLGRTEWKQSLPTCERLAERLGLELIVVRRGAGDMLSRWQTRWNNNVERYVSLSCVKLILPWSTASMRFCTSEMKTAVICADLIRRFPGQQILSVTGIRRDESRSKTSGRAIAPICQPQSRLLSKKHQTSGFNWNPILDWKMSDVLSYLKAKHFPLHEAYATYGSSRVSCCFCILASKADLRAASTCRDNADLYRSMVDLELDSTFSFQDSGWLCDVAPDLLAPSQLAVRTWAKERAAVRQQAESRIPKHLLYTKGWPTCVPTIPESELLAEVRRDVSTAVGLNASYLDPLSVRRRYQELMDAKASAA
jgi:3'-phosphoadenosine 5'-phosphosulfate sulfotransferase (PAPS reductase)/FAD synthetase